MSTSTPDHDKAEGLGEAPVAAGTTKDGTPSEKQAWLPSARPRDEQQQQQYQSATRASPQEDSSSVSSSLKTLGTRITRIANDAAKKKEKEFSPELMSFLSMLYDEDKEKKQSENSGFGKWMKQWEPTEKCPREAAVALAKSLLEAERGKQSSAAAQVSAATTFDERKPSSLPLKQEQPLVCWKGISVEWFLDIFMQTPAVQKLSSFGCPMWFIRDFGIPEMMRQKGITSGSFVDRIESYLGGNDEMFVSRNDGGETNRLPICGDATAFVSYTGSYSLKHFAELVGHDDLVGKYVWMDILCVDQFAWNSCKDEDMKKFKQDFMNDLRWRISKSGIGYTALMMDHWCDFMGALGRIWVVWELFSTVDGDAELHVLYRKNEHMRFMWEGLSMESGFDRVTNNLAKLDARKASAKYQEDKDLIMDIIETHGGVQRVNANILQRLREWLLETGKGHYEKTRSPELGNNLASLYQSMGRLPESLAMKREVLACCIEKFGDKDIRTLTVMTNLANSCGLQEGNLDEAEKLYRTSFTVLQKEFGERHSATLRSMSGMAALLGDKNQFAQSLELHRRVLAIRRESLGDKDPSTLSSFGNVAVALDHHWLNLAERQALSAHMIAVNGRKEVLGPKHPDTLRSMNALAKHHQDK